MTVSGKKIIWISVAALLVVLLGAMIGLYVWVPHYIESELIPRLAQSRGLDPQQVRVRRIGIGGADLGPIKLGKDAQPRIRIGTIQIDYSLWSLLRRRVKGIRISGFQAELNPTAAGIGDTAKKQPAQRPSDPNADADIQLSDLLPIEIGYLKIEHGQVILTRASHHMVVLFNINLDTSGLKKGKLACLVQAEFNGNQVDVKAEIDQPANLARVNLAGNDLDLQVLSSMWNQTPQTALTGMADLTGQGTIRLKPLEIDALSVKASLHRLHVAASRLIIENLDMAGQNPPQLVISIDREGPQQYRWQCSPFQISAPFTTRMTELNGHWSKNSAGWKLDLNGHSQSPSQPLNPGLRLKTPLAIQWLATAEGESANQINFTAQADAVHPTALAMGAAQTEHPNLSITAQGNFESEALTAKVQLTSDKSRLALPEATVRVDGFKVMGDLSSSPLASELPYSLKIKTIIQKVSAQTGQASVTMPAILIDAAGQGDSAQPLRLQGQVSIKPGRIRQKQHGIVISGLAARMPFNWPPIDHQPAGNLRVRQIQWQDQAMGGMQGQIRQQNDGLAMALNHSSKLFPGLNVIINGTLNRQGGFVVLKVPPFQPAEGLEAGRFWPQADGLRIKGRFQGNCKLTLNRDGLAGTAQLSVKDGNLIHDTQDMDLDGIQMDLHLEDLLTLRSAPRQQLLIKSLRFGQLVADDLQLDFRTETPHSVFIEKAAIRWSKGTINAGALHIQPGHDQYALTLFCDRLDLATVLEQLGAAEASGEGAVNGRIPLRWAKGALTFDQGFLFSTPGKSGTIRLRGTQALLAGLPPGTPQHTQLDIATEALKDYTYKWARLYLDSENENLLLKLQFDGKPNRQLPFAYDTKLGSFKRVAGQGQADFTGISIDLNFSSPLNEILQYKKLLTPNQD